MIAAAMILVGLFGWISEFMHRNAEKKGIRQRFQCDLCLTVWQELHKTKIACCPHCGMSCAKNRK
jgi:ribosomal protein L37AE/L43A